MAKIAIMVGTVYGAAQYVAEQADALLTGLGHQIARYDEAKLEAYRAAGEPVFVNLTAAWCITCMVNERTALSSEAKKTGVPCVKLPKP